MIAIIDYKIGNIGSLVNVFDYLDEEVRVISDPSLIKDYTAIVLPGVGAYDTALTALEQTGFIEPIKEYVISGKPALGICLGMQLFCNKSEEGIKKGLGLIDGDIRSLKNLGCTGKIPHVGFNEITNVDGDSSFYTDIKGNDFYFVHSYALSKLKDSSEDVSLGYSEYEGVKFISTLKQGNIFASQFHPEKSSSAGLKFIRSFLKCLKKD